MRIGCVKEIKHHEYRVGLTPSCVRMIAEHGVEEASRRSPAISKGVNLYNGECVYENVAKAFDMTFTPLQKFF